MPLAGPLESSVELASPTRPRTVRKIDENGKRTTEILVDINRDALSKRGWEVLEIRARVTTEFDDGGSPFHEVNLFGTARFNPLGWVDCFRFSRELSAPIVVTISSRSLSEFDISLLAFFASGEDLLKPIRFSGSRPFDTRSSFDHDDVFITVACFDAYEGGAFRLPTQPVKLDVEIVDETGRKGVSLRIDSADVLAFRAVSDGVEYGNIKLSGTILVGKLSDVWAMFRDADWIHDEKRLDASVPFCVSVPSIAIEFFDETGFLVGQEQVRLSAEVPVDSDCRLPSRVGEWLVDSAFDPSEFSAPPTRAVVRIVDFVA
ncbi:hypothetical protein [Williamsia sp.]|uniref:hypothetical protein n=1 Tax=Williamsia sp. TaxID=1872085 RepID=UPI0025E97DB6|nr:hypothetical protein [Williamsia sp.]